MEPKKLPQDRQIEKGSYLEIIIRDTSSLRYLYLLRQRTVRTRLWAKDQERHNVERGV